MIAWAAGEVAAVTLRIFVYLDLLLLAGLSLCSVRTAPIDVPGRVIAALAGAGAVLTIAQFLAIALAMTGGDLAVLDAEMFRYLALDTAMGISSGARFLLLLIATAVAVRAPEARLIHSVLAVAALATLAWSGHAGVSDGTVGTVHRASDIVHLLAASLWLGALAILLVSLRRAKTSPADLVVALGRFAITGSVIVAALLATGLINLWAIVGFDGLPDLPGTRYGKVLAFKVLLFAAMLVFAALNRWRFTPRLASGSSDALQSLRRSVTIEASLAIGVVLAVAFIGILPPTG